MNVALLVNKVPYRLYLNIRSREFPKTTYIVFIPHTRVYLRSVSNVMANLGPHYLSVRRLPSEDFPENP
jgi:hypothetical protein